MITLAIQTGLRISELTGLACSDVVLGTGAHVRCLGKGRKQRHTPLLPLTVEVVRTWLAERHGAPSDPLFPTGTGHPLSRAGTTETQTETPPRDPSSESCG
jgi:integrase/recombinase XerD